MSIQFLFSLTFRTSYIQANVNHVIMTWHVGSPVNSKLIYNCRLAGFSVTNKYEKRIKLVQIIQNIFTYTSTRTGKAASLSSSRQLGGNRICTAARVPCVSGISKERCVGKAKASSFLENCLRVSYNTLMSLWVFAECTPVNEINWKKLISIIHDQTHKRTLLCHVKMFHRVSWKKIPTAQ